MATIKYLLQSKKENSSIHLRLSISRDLVLKKKTGLFINYNDWSLSRALPKQTIGGNKNISASLTDLSVTVTQKLNEANSKGVIINGDWLENVIEVYFGRKEESGRSNLLTDAIQDIIDNASTRMNSKRQRGLSKSRINSYKSLKRIIIDFQNDEPIKVVDVDKSFSQKFDNYMKNIKGYQESYAVKKMADIKIACNDANGYGIPISNDLNNIKTPIASNENIIYLNQSEIDQIENSFIENEALKNARTWLILGCNIGQRGGDLLKLTKKNFVKKSGLEIIQLKQQKTGKNVTIPVLEKTKQILKEGLPYPITIQKFNKYIKKVCELSGIDEPTKGSKIEVIEKGKGNIQKRKIQGIYPKFELIGSHVCRRSYASNRYGNLPTALIMKVTGHSTEKMLCNYIAQNEIDFAQQIVDFYTLQAQKQKKESNLSIVKDAAVNE